MAGTRRDHPPCRFLRTKVFHIDPKGGRAFLEETIPTEHYWCLWTMGPAGPDDKPSEPDRCVRSRGCFRPMEEGEV